ncbi:hypothetical protein GTO91_16040 [Heliobacterium undosum]|uniref:Uncharacterized protein n=1 Tax=Heliomicrobium undosum TaxID=121734 RepID=A0A845LC20_9FIRM|nr:hypothetical protein [Heliomicrobium undosum]MZP31218.1 hypothetical protein [Heliomicrobium undosum]
MDFPKLVDGHAFIAVKKKIQGNNNGMFTTEQIILELEEEGYIIDTQERLIEMGKKAKIRNLARQAKTLDGKRQDFSIVAMQGDIFGNETPIGKGGRAYVSYEKLDSTPALKDLIVKTATQTFIARLKNLPFVPDVVVNRVTEAIGKVINEWLKAS